MSTLKCLQLDFWMTIDWLREDTLSHYKRVESAIERPGVYAEPGACWFVLEDGRAFEYDRGMFNLQLALLNLPNYCEAQWAAVHEAVKQRVASKDLRALAQLHQHSLELHDIRRFAAKGRNRALREYTP